MAAIEPRVEDQLRRISGEIAWYEEQTRKTVALMLQYRLEIGRRLARAKALLPHGRFLSWAQSEFNWTARHIQNHLALEANAAQVSRLSPDTSLSSALALIKKSQNPSAGSQPGVSRHGHRLSLVRRIHLIGEIEEGDLDCDQLITEMVRIAAMLGAPKTRWKAS